jgi:hypothetical protein
MTKRPSLQTKLQRSLLSSALHVASSFPTAFAFCGMTSTSEISIEGKKAEKSILSKKTGSLVTLSI